MPIHDSYARTTPYELLLPTEGFAEEWFPKIREEAEGRGGSLALAESFVLLAEAALALREIRGEEDAPELIQQHGALLFHAFHFHEGGEPLYLIETAVVRFLVENGPEEGEWEPKLPGKAGYLQLPQHLFWTAGEDGDAPESLDGIFWSAPDGESVTLLVVMGIRKDRSGLAVVPLPNLPLSAAAPWASMAVRPDGDDFQSSLPGAEMEGLYSLASGAEALKLAMRVLWYLDVFPGRVTAGQGPESEAEGDPAPSQLPYRRVIAGKG